ncbi:LamG-like jellyroll fold domain-containing protein [Agaribacterium sp. ZY112]|uniref:LamG-like jellyroll fold domain-containing protein n=1 Tax=Agaribacterium sp. ZY112 TaxID=3233574 RepID=UPI003523F08D
MNKREEQLVADYLAGLDVDDALLEACDKNPELLRYLVEQRAWQRQLKHALLTQGDKAFMRGIQARIEERALSADTVSGEQGSIRPKSYARGFVPWLAACAVLIMGLFIFDASYLQRELGSISKLTAVSTGSKSLQKGQSIYRGPFHLDQGYAEVSLKNGVTLVLEAPVELDLKSYAHIILNRGSLVARVPEQAVGFKVDTPSSYIVDLGTEFGVSVDSQGESQVHVLDGEVKVRASDKQEFEYLVKDQARAFDLEQQVAQIESQPQRFMRTLPGTSSDAPAYMHWQLDQAEGGRYRCRGPGIADQCFSAEVKTLNHAAPAPKPVTGVFQQAIYFNGRDNWLATEFPGIGGNKPRTVAFWVKVPKDFSVSEGFGILSWGLHDQQNAWQISINPLDVSGPLGRIRIGTAEGVVVGDSDLRDEQWHHVAIVLFGGEAVDLSTHVLIYIDGELEATPHKSITRVNTDINHPRSKPLVMGRNIAFDNPYKENKFFRGSLDEVYIFDSALDQEAIKSLVENNRL